MTIKEILDKFENSSKDITLVKNLEICVRLKSVPQEYLCGIPIVLEDGSGELEAVSTKSIFPLLQHKIGQLLKLKGRLDKTEFGNIGFLIQEILD